ncbi:MAG: glycoside hydrolase family protein [Planctomycetota bacterium]|jgi:hypothetical protein
MPIDLARVRNPSIVPGPEGAVRDPALVVGDGGDGGVVIRCFHTSAAPSGERYQLCLDVAESADLVTWSAPERLTTSELNFSSPGNAIRVGDEWVLCVQSYPVEPGRKCGSEESRLWLMRSRDLVRWSAPEPMHPQGCRARWTDSHRQIDPYLIRSDVGDGVRYWCFYKTSGQLGLLVSDDLESWEEASPDRPVLGRDQTPDGKTVENPCVVRADGGYAMLFAPCRKGRGIGLAYSDDLVTWRDVHYVEFPSLDWADNGPTAAMAIDARDELGVWLMAFHGERRGGANAHAAAIGFAWSEDLEHWTVP